MRGRGNHHFHFPKFTEKFDIELLSRVCWLDKVVAFLHCCVLHMFLPMGNCISRVTFLSQKTCHRGWNPMPGRCQACSQGCETLVQKGLQPKLLPKLLPRWQPSLQPSLQLESPSLWPLLSMCSSSKSNTLTKESGTQSLCLNRPEHASQTAVFRCFSSSGRPC